MWKQSSSRVCCGPYSDRGFHYYHDCHVATVSGLGEGGRGGGEVFLARIDRAATSIGQGIRVDGDPFDDDLVLGPILLIGFDGLDLGECGDALVADELAEDGIEAVEVGCLIEEEEELRAVGSRPLVGHGHDAARVVPQRGPDLVLERPAPDRPPALRVLLRRMRRRPRLHHEPRDQPVEGRLIVVARGAQG